MKFPLTWIGASLIVVCLAAIGVRADVPWRFGWRYRAGMGYIENGLNLTSAQKAQISSIWKTEKPTIAHLVTEFARENNEMESVTSQSHPDPDKIQSIAREIPSPNCSSKKRNSRCKLNHRFSLPISELRQTASRNMSMIASTQSHTG